MTHKTIKIAVALMCISQINPTSADAQPSDQMVQTRELLGWCADGSSAGSAACTAFVMGVSNSAMTPSASSCPGSATRSQIRAAVVQDILTLQPPAPELPAALPVLVALQRAFPCKS